jgi:hypothetical protein
VEWEVELGVAFLERKSHNGLRSILDTYRKHALAALALEFGHGGLDELLGTVDLVENGFEVERGLGGVAIGDAVDAMLTDEDEGVGEHVERDSEAASLGTEHELVLL